MNHPLPRSSVSQHLGPLNQSARAKPDVTAKIVHAWIMSDKNEREIAHTGKFKKVLSGHDREVCEYGLNQMLAATIYQGRG